VPDWRFESRRSDTIRLGDRICRSAKRPSRRVVGPRFRKRPHSRRSARASPFRPAPFTDCRTGCSARRLDYAASVFAERTLCRRLQGSIGGQAMFRRGSVVGMRTGPARGTDDREPGNDDAFQNLAISATSSRPGVGCIWPPSSRRRPTAADSCACSALPPVADLSPAPDQASAHPRRPHQRIPANGVAAQLGISGRVLEPRRLKM